MRHADFLFVNTSRRRFADVAFLAFLRPRREFAVLTHQEERVFVRYVEHQFQRREIAVRDPQVVFLDGRLDFMEQRPFLGVTVFAGNHLDEHSVTRIKYGEDESRQRRRLMCPRVFEAMFGSRLLSLLYTDLIETSMSS